MDTTTPIFLGHAELADQGFLGSLLLEVYGPPLESERAAAVTAGLSTSSSEDEFMAADDFYFSTIDLMDCCFLAKAENKVIGAACINPYIAQLQYVAVSAKWRRKGIGRKLVELALMEMRKRGLDHVRADASLALADTGGKAFLETLGFQEIRRETVLAMRL